ncbi:MAG: isoaspartyl peptidase/L-asparaginase [Flavobacteriales bacterium]|nr:isoaspartyl peptidase/L-asparaginase [Flavobacteriales bacterium]
MGRTTLVIHGGAGTLLKSEMSAEKEAAYLAALQDALEAGNRILTKGGSALDAVEVAVKTMEDSPLFNAGKGSVFTADGTHEMDASIMSGKDRMAGAVCGVSSVKNPVLLARLVMEKTEHVMLAGAGAEQFGRDMKVDFEDAAYFDEEWRRKQWLSVKGTHQTALDHNINPDRKFGTVGAVAIDKEGNLAAATSTGGMTNKKYGRVGDSPIIGAGTYANNSTCAVSCTGSGEFFIRGVVAYEVSALMEFKGLSLQQACDEVIHKRVLELGGDGGLIAVDAQGNPAMVFNTEGMYRGFVKESEAMQLAIYKNA